jgi:4-diphosphocytidyl-2-C-methyl-D-erythritol kinase
MSRPPAIVERARAKVNLTLNVHGRRGDGYHELESLVTFADVHDRVTLQPGAPCGVEVAGPWAQEIAGENLLARTLALLRDTGPALRLGAVHLEKRLPVAAGLGGGSADAAALLRAVRRANGERADGIPWMEIAARLGSDVPVCLAGCPAMIWGRGERVGALPSLPAMPAVLVNPRKPLPTGPVFAALRRGPAVPTGEMPPAPVLADLSAALDYMRARGNHLEPAAVGLMPEIEEVKAALAAQTGCRLVAMSGSGPTCFAVFSTAADAARAAAGVADVRPGWWVACTTLAGTAAPATP